MRFSSDFDSISHMAPSALGPSLPDHDSPVTMSFGAVGTPRRSGSLASSAYNNSISNPAGSRAGSRMAMHLPNDDPGASAQHLWDRYQQIKNTEVTKNVLLEEVLNRYAYLQNTHDDYVRSTEQQLAESNVRELHTSRKDVEKLIDMLEVDPFVMVLIDGDGMIFTSNLLQLGEEGGRQAADRLHRAVIDWMRADVNGFPAHCQVVIRVYANVKGLADTCTRAGIVSSPIIIEDFVRGFTRSNEHFDFIDVGYGKDRADVKVNALLKLHLRGYQCRHILFGCSHDNGYARVLESFSLDPVALRDVTLLEGVPFEKELAQLPHNKTKFPGLFRNTKIDPAGVDLITDGPRSRHDSKSGFNPASGVFMPSGIQTPAATPPTIASRLGPRIGSPALSIPLRDATSRSNSISSSAISEAPTAGVNNSWAGMAKRAAHRPLQDLPKAAPEPKAAGPVVRQNKSGQRLDVHMDYDHDRVFELKKLKLCNQHYIGRGCCHYEAGNGACPHKHDYNLTAKDSKWLRVVARETVCKKGTACVDFECIYGHHCPYPKANEGSMRGIGCINGENCRFAREMHGMDMTVAKVLHPPKEEQYE